MKQDAIWDYFQNDGRAVFQHSRPRLRYLARQLTPGQRVLNIGVGGGVFEEAAIARGLDVHCVDPSERAIEELRSRLSLGDKARVGRGQSIPFSDASFDAIVVSEVMEHLADDALFPMVREIGRVLGPGGLLLGTVPSCEDLTDQQVVCPDCSKVFHRWGHVRTFSPQKMRQLLEGAFDILALNETMFFDWEAMGWRQKITCAFRALHLAIGARYMWMTLYFKARRL